MTEEEELMRHSSDLLLRVDDVRSQLQEVGVPYRKAVFIEEALRKIEDIGRALQAKATET